MPDGRTALRSEVPDIYIYIYSDGKARELYCSAMEKEKKREGDSEREQHLSFDIQPAQRIVVGVLCII